MTEKSPQGVEDDSLELVLCESEARNLLSIHAEVQGQLESREFGLELLRREYEIWSRDKGLRLLKRASQARERLELILRDECGEHAFLEFLGHAKPPEMEPKREKVARSVRYWWLRSRSCSHDRMLRQLRRDILEEKEDHEGVFGRETLDALQATEDDGGSTSEILELVRRALEGLMETFANKFWGGSYYGFWIQDSVMKVLLLDDYGCAAFMLFLKNATGTKAEFAREWWSRISHCERRNSYVDMDRAPSSGSFALPQHIQVIVDDLTELLEKSETRFFRRTSDVLDSETPWSASKVRKFMTAVRRDVRGIMASQLLLSSFWESPQWVAWMDEKRRERIGESIFSKKAAAQKERVLAEARRYIPNDIDNNIVEPLETVLNQNLGKWQRILDERDDKIRRREILVTTRMQALVRGFIGRISPEKIFRRGVFSAVVHVQSLVRMLLVRAKRARDCMVATSHQDSLRCNRISPCLFTESMNVRGESDRRQEFCNNFVRRCKTNLKMYPNARTASAAAIAIQASIRKLQARRRVLIERQQFINEVSIHVSKATSKEVRDHFARLRSKRRKERLERRRLEAKPLELRARKSAQVHAHEEEVAPPPPKKDPATGALLSLDTTLWCDDYLARKKKIVVRAPRIPAEGKPIEIPWACPKPFESAHLARSAISSRRECKKATKLPERESPTWPTKVKRAEKPKRSERAAKEEDVPNAVHSREKNCAERTIATDCQKTHVAFEAKVREEIQAEDLNRKLQSGLRNSRAASIRFATNSVVKQQRSRVALKRIRHDHQVAMVVRLRDAGILR